MQQMDLELIRSKQLKKFFQNTIEPGYMGMHLNPNFLKNVE